MALRPISRVWQNDRLVECVVYADEERRRWEVRLKRGPLVLHQVELADASTAYATALRWRRDAEFLVRRANAAS